MPPLAVVQPASTRAGPRPRERAAAPAAAPFPDRPEGPAAGAAQQEAIEMLTAEFPHWHAWRGVTGLLYARRPRSSPPKVVRAATAWALADQIRLAEGGLDPVPGLAALRKRPLPSCTGVCMITVMVRQNALAVAASPAQHGVRGGHAPDPTAGTLNAATSQLGGREAVSRRVPAVGPAAHQTC